MEENENEKEAESGKEKEKEEKKHKKKDKVKETKNPQKTKHSSKKDCKRNFHLPYNNTATVYTQLDSLNPADVFIFAEKNLEVSINKIDSVSDTKRLEENEHEDSDEEEEDKTKIPPPHSPKKKGLDICEP